MDLLRLGDQGLSSPHKRRKWLILMAVSCVSGYGVYKVYHSLSVTTKRKRLIKILGAFLSVAELISDSAETMTTVSQDVKRFLNSDSDNIPNSLKQISKIATSDEFTSSLSTVSQAVTVGVSRGRSSFESTGTGPEPSLVDRVVDKAFSEEGGRFLSAVVGSFAKNLVLGFHSKDVKNDSEEMTPQWVRLLGDDKCRELLSDCIERFTSTAVSVYLDKTMDINTYDQIFEGLTNPKHQDRVKDLLVTVSSGALQTIVRSSHDVFTSSSSSSRSNIEEMKTRC
ncbi:BnaC08g42360D [Brassica napus]|uniref:BnaC08g42360D protein n=1 Tax=Brassica napus TaxID=3708 RepID=A0A078GC32_BRANA|nr:protein PHLOEM PROTEIN 2-LIKE A10 [Brassica napus]CDY22602.1 BnaC08g42360D [Brassica napus]